MDLDIRCEPTHILVKNGTLELCPCCSSTLQKEVKKGYYRIECGYCKYQDRAFVTYSSSCRGSAGGCTCEEEEKDFLYISCDQCLTPKCIGCKEPVSNEADYEGNRCRYTECNNKRCDQMLCVSCKQKKCLMCKTVILCHNLNCTSVYHDSCLRKIELEQEAHDRKIEFGKQWKQMTPLEKLEIHGIEKLKLLAKKKALKGYSKLKKEELIHLLGPMVSTNDFPIK